MNVVLVVGENSSGLVVGSSRSNRSSKSKILIWDGLRRLEEPQVPQPQVCPKEELCGHAVLRFNDGGEDVVVDDIDDDIIFAHKSTFNVMTT